MMYTMFEVFFSFLMIIVSIIVSEKLTTVMHFQDSFNHILYFSAAQNFVDFVSFTGLSDRGKV